MERKRAEARREASVERLEALLDALPVGVCFSEDRTCQRTNGNAVLRRQFEASPEDNLSASAPEPDAAGRRIRYWREGRLLTADELPLQCAASENKVIPPEECEVEMPGGRRWILETSASPVHDRAGQVIGAVAVTVDITERKRLEHADEEGRARLAGIVESAMDAIITLDEEQRVVLFNAAAERMFGCPAAEAIGGPIDRFIPARFREAHRGHVRGFGESGATSRAMGALGSLSAVRADGTEFPIEASISQVEVAGKKLFTVILRDVTQRTREEAAARVRELQQRAVADLSQHALDDPGLDSLIDGALTLVAQLLRVELCKVLELTPAGDQLTLRASIGFREGCEGMVAMPPGAGSQAAYTLASHEPVVVDDLAAEARFRPDSMLLDHGATSGVSTVLQGRKRPYGIFGAFTTRRRAFSSDDIHFVQAIADVLAAAIERRQLEEELLAISGREQRRIGQDLHDGLCQQLAGIEFRTEALARDLEENPAARVEAEKIGALLREGMRQARMLARGLAPVELEKNGLMSALTELCKDSAQLYRTECRFQCDRPVLLSGIGAATHLYRIAQEAISNAVHHGHAKTITVELRDEGAEAALAVTNDGEQLPADSGREGGMGLRIMEYRAEMMGATLRLGSTAEGKTELKCAFKPNR